VSANSSIEWTDATWTPIRARRKDTGKVGVHCERVSAGCANCYSATFNRRNLPNQGTGLDFVRSSRDLVDIFVDHGILAQPLHWKRPRKIFVCSQTDLFAEFVTDDMIDHVFVMMGACDDQGLGHEFQILTKRPERMRTYMLERSRKAWNGPRMNRSAFPPRNVWLGVSVEDKNNLERIDELRSTPAAVRFVSFEPLLEDLRGLILEGIHWAIVGGESGPKARPCVVDWIRHVQRQCGGWGVPCFVKQLGAYPVGGWREDSTEWPQEPDSPFGRDSDDVFEGGYIRLKDRKGGAIEEWPDDLRVREYPRAVSQSAESRP
jgi:protein gp37